MKTFSINEAVRAGWRRTAGHRVFLGVLTFVSFALSFVGEFISESMSESLLMNLFSAIVSLIATLVLLHVAIDITRGRRVSVSTMFPAGNRMLAFLGATIVVMIVSFILTVLVVGGVFLIGVPILFSGAFDGVEPHSPIVTGVGVIGITFLMLASIYIGIRLQFYQYAIIGDGAGVFGSFVKSWRATRGAFWRLFGLAFAITFINLVGALVFLVGLLVTLPVTLVAMAYVYDTLRQGSEPPAPEAPDGVQPPSPPAPER